ncbi:hypothetical protein BC940DRAFT_345915 [Gongronella butleri]|nr:hypothetical protein BC940DRAFT_345915 [Gongronella butleri]
MATTIPTVIETPGQPVVSESSPSKRKEAPDAKTTSSDAKRAKESKPAAATTTKKTHTPSTDGRTTGQALLQAVTAKRLVQQALERGEKPKKTHVYFNDIGQITKKKQTEAIDETALGAAAAAQDKTAKKKKRAIAPAPQIMDSKRRKDSLEYLKAYTHDRANWKFSKLFQTWLLQYMFDGEAVPKDDFDMLLDYLKDLKGRARDATLEEAQTICQETKIVEAPKLVLQQPVNAGNYYDDDFDAEKMLAGVSSAPAPAATPNDDFDAEKLLAAAATSGSAAATGANASDNKIVVKLERAKAIVRVLQ